MFGGRGDEAGCRRAHQLDHCQLISHPLTEDKNNDLIEPSNFDSAWNHPDKNQRMKWREAIKKEFGDMMKYKVWRKIPRSEVPYERRTIGSKWVFKIKRDGRFRARLCGLGYTQIPGVDFTENHAPVVNDVTFRILLILKIINNWDTELFDVETAFLNGILEELIFMNLPEGAEEVKLYETINRKLECLQLIKCIYGTVQSARQWYKRFVEELKKLGFEKCLIDPCLLSRTDETGTIIICLYVDDILTVGDKNAINKFHDDIKNIFTVKKSGNLEDYLGCNIKFSNDGDEASMVQPHIVKKLKEKFHDLTKDIKVRDTPCAAGSIVVREFNDDIELNNDEQSLYRSGIGILLYLAKYTRPDIANGVREHSKNMDRASTNDYKSLLRMIKYVLTTSNKGIILRPKISGNKLQLCGYCDSDYATDRETRKSITGFVIYLCDVPISWRSRAQRGVTLSSTESEYYAISEICSEILFIKGIMDYLGIDMEYPIIVNVDNVGAIYLAKNQVLSQRTKHIGVRYHFVRDYIEDGLVKIIFVKSQNNDADMFTKNLPNELFKKHTEKVMNR